MLIYVAVVCPILGFVFYSNGTTESHRLVNAKHADVILTIVGTFSL
jgi:uncharacterized protein (DUF2164 family)